VLYAVIDAGVLSQKDLKEVKVSIAIKYKEDYEDKANTNGMLEMRAPVDTQAE